MDMAIPPGDPSMAHVKTLRLPQPIMLGKDGKARPMALYRERRIVEWACLTKGPNRAKAYAVMVKAAQSGMACDNALTALGCALDEARDLILGEATVPKTEIPLSDD